MTMTRIRGHAGETDWCELEKLAKKLGIKVQYRRARCEHGKTPDQTCRDCEGGYVQDTSVYANLPADVMAVAVSDDGSDVAFLPDWSAR
jgi:hypothetical protein